MFGSKSVVGLDIGSSKVKAIQLRKSGNRLEIERFGVADVYPGGDRSAAQASPFELKIAAARAALDSGRITSKYAVSAVAGESIIVRYIQMLDMPEAELKNALRWEAEDYLPFALDEVNIDSVILGPSATVGKVDVLLVCGRKDLITEHYQIVRSVGLTPLVVDVEGFAFLNAFEELYKPSATDCFALLNLGAETTNINIYINGTSRFSRDIPIAGNAITQAIATKTNLPWMKAEQLKRELGAPTPEGKDDMGEADSALISTIRGTVERITGGDLGDSTADAATQKAIQQTIDQMLGEVRRSIHFFENQSGGATVQRVFIGGGTSKMKNISNYLTSALELPVEIVDPLRNVTVSRDVNRESLEEHRGQLLVGMGLALRKVMD